MLKFRNFKTEVNSQFTKMAKGDLFTTDVDKDTMWKTYLESFPEGSNPIFKERTEHDCQCCKQFIRACGNVVSIVDNQLESIWDIQINGPYHVVAKAMSKLVKSKKIKNIFLHYQKNLGTDYNHQSVATPDGEGIVKWEHFHFKLPLKFVYVADLETELSKCKSNKDVFLRGLKEITTDAIDTVLDLIGQKSLYRGEENKDAVEAFAKLEIVAELGTLNELDRYAWVNANKPGARIRNTAIGTLLIDISEGMELTQAVGRFESKVAPANYKRPTAVITKKMIANAQTTVQELGIESSLNRRYAITDDITINNILFADRTTRKVMNVFDELAKAASVNTKNLDKVEEVSIGTFIDTILPKATDLEIMVENKHTNNLMSLISPQDKNAPGIFKWGNNFSWAYNGEMADSMKQRVKRAGGNVEGVLRFSIQWNDDGKNQNDFDAHCHEPNRNLISYPTAGNIQPSSGILDVDIVNPGNKVAVENITWSNINKMQEGKYEFKVHNYSSNISKAGFTAEIEYDGVIYSYKYNKRLRGNEKVPVAELTFNKKGGIKFITSMPTITSQKEVWGISTHTFSNVSMVMNSPNHWDGEKTGNKHFFFILENCKNEEKARGFFNEFLNENLSKHRKVFEVLGDKLKAEKSDNQLSGIGFSSTQRNSVFCKVQGSFNRTIKINF